MGTEAIKVQARNVKAWFGDNQILKGIDIAIADKEVTAIIGPSGCGKSTFIRCINRMHELVDIARFEGSITLDDKEVYDDKVDPVLLRRVVGMVFQKPNPFPTMSIKDNVLSGLKMTGQLKNRDAEELIERSLSQAALWSEVKDRLNEPGGSLSGGQQQRLCIARSLAVSPEVLLMDEPCSALDPIATARIEDLLNDLSKKYAIVIVTHNMQQATRVSNKTAFFLHGELIEFGDTGRLFTHPQDKRTEDYITGKFG